MLGSTRAVDFTTAGAAKTREEKGWQKKPACRPLLKSKRPRSARNEFRGAGVNQTVGQ